MRSLAIGQTGKRGCLPSKSFLEELYLFQKCGKAQMDGQQLVDHYVVNQNTWKKMSKPNQKTD